MSALKIEFSQKALERSNRNSSNYILSSVRSRWTWILLSSVTIFFAAMVAWGLYGRMSESVSGVGITMLSHGSRPVVAGASGTISHLNIMSGSQVRSEQVLGQIYNAETFYRIQKLETEYELLASQIKILSQGVDTLSAQQMELGEKKKSYLDYLSGEYEKGKARTTELVEIYRHLKSIDAVSKSSYYQVLDQRLQTEASMIATVLQNIAAEAERQTLVRDSEQKLIALQQQLDVKAHELKMAEQLYHDSFWIHSEFDGTVRELLKEDGAFVQQGEKIALIDSPHQKGIYLLAFVAAEEGKKIRNGMSAFFSPAAIPANTFGYLRCVVREVSEQPNTAESIQAELMNTSLTQMIAGKTVMVRVVLEIIPDASQESKFSWTSRDGAPTVISSGMLGKLTINTRYKAPASYIIPAVRKFLHGDDLGAKQEDL